jgi:Zn finger protein HypA/HybF involved in hydrogenase expression
MSTKKQFECENCGAIGTIVVRGDEFVSDDIVYCPLCSSDIYEEDLEDYEE